MSARDELARLIRENRKPWATNAEHQEMEDTQAGAILEAGYRKPRTITSAADLIDAAEESVFLAGRHVYRKQRGALMDLEVGLMSYEEVLDEEGVLLLVHEGTPS